MTEPLDISKVQRQIYDFVAAGTLDERVLDRLWCDGKFVPKECELWDYKRHVSTEAETKAKTVLQVVSFYNTYGGYLIYGVDEVENDRVFLPIGINENDLDLQQLRECIRNYTGEVIDVSYNVVNFSLAGNVALGVLHIPKRPASVSPVFFGKNGPAVGQNKLLFQKDQAFIRLQDSCVPAVKKTEMQLLFGPRNLAWQDEAPFPLSREEPLYNNLPDRNLICSSFVGREAIIEQLWRWLGDPFSHVKLLAGDGGKGKTSIAYEFTEEVCRNKPFDFEKVVWLTAKSRQFFGIHDEYRSMPETHFGDVTTLLQAICEELAVLEVEIEGASPNLVKKTVKRQLETIPCLIVIDDVDSLEVDEQKKVMELAMQLSGTKSRLLLTTRMNLSYSADSCITVPGLGLNEFRAYLEMWEEKLGVNLKQQEVQKLHEVTDGSPLFAESIVRLLRAGVEFGEAVRQWRGSAGDAVRRAALLREVESLCPEGRRLLLALSHMSEASRAELRQVTGYDDMVLEKGLTELRTLFLVSSPPIIKTEPRYRVSNNTALLVLQNGGDLVLDPRVIEDQVKRLRQGNKRLNAAGTRKTVGAAINQAIALLKEDRADEALETVNQALGTLPKNPDLLLAKGRCLLKLDLPKLDEARKVFQRAYDAGQRREMLYELWFQAESDSKHPNGMVDVATLAVDEQVGDQWEWRQKRAYAYWLLARAHSKVMNLNQARNEYEKSAEDMGVLIRHVNDGEKQPLIEMSTKLHDEVWELVATSDSWSGGVDAFDVAISAIKRGDLRNVNYYRACEAIDRLIENAGQPWTERARNAVGQRIGILDGLVERRRGHPSAKIMIDRVTTQLGSFTDTVAERTKN